MGSSEDGKVDRSRECSERCDKPWEAEGYHAKLEYESMRSLFAHCWACGAFRRPEGYYGPWLIERAHIANKPRREDRRLVVMLCSICHKFSHGEYMSRFLRPKLTAGQMISLKSQCDPDWFDLKFIQKHSVRILESEPLVGWYFEERARNRAT
jgi:hypothetical protein